MVRTVMTKRKHFLPFVLSVDRMLGMEAMIVLSQLSQTMAEKSEEPTLASTRVGKRSNFQSWLQVPTHV